MKSITIILVSLLVIMGGVFGTTTTANAQCSLCACPSIAGWYPTVPWQHNSATIVYTVGGVTCSTYVCYCYRNLLVAPITEVYLCSFTQLVTPPCPAFNGWDQRKIIRYLLEEILKKNPDSLFPPCPECPIAYTNYRTFLAGCKNGGVYCYNPMGACTVTYSKCCIDGEVQLTETGREFLGSCPENCSPESCYGDW